MAPSPSSGEAMGDCAPAGAGVGGGRHTHNRSDGCTWKKGGGRLESLSPSLLGFCFGADLEQGSASGIERKSLTRRTGSRTSWTPCLRGWVRGREELSMTPRFLAWKDADVISEIGNSGAGAT